MNGETILHGRPVAEWSTLLKTTSKTKLLDSIPNFGKVKFDQVKAAVDAFDAAQTNLATAASDPAIQNDPADAAELPSAGEVPEQPRTVDSPAEVPSTDPPPAEQAAPVPVTMDVVLADLRDQVCAPTGYIQRTPQPRFTARQAELLNRMHGVLLGRGVKLRDQSHVLGWIMDQIAEAIDEVPGAASET